MVLSALTSVRDVVLVVWGVLSIVLLAALLVVTIVLGVTIKRLVESVNRTLHEGVMPMLESAKETVDTVSGTTRYVSDALVNPIIRASAALAGARRFTSSLLGFGGRGKKKGGR